MTKNKKKQKQKKNFKFTKKHFGICAVVFVLLIVLIYGFYVHRQNIANKNANKFISKKNFPSSHYYWPEKELERTNTRQDSLGQFETETTYQAADTETIYIKRVSKNKKTGEKKTEYWALVVPDIAHSKEVFDVIHQSGKKHFGTEESIYTNYGTSPQKTEATIAALHQKTNGQDGTRFLFCSNKRKGDFKFVGIVSISRLWKNQGDTSTQAVSYVRNISYAFGAHNVTKVKGAAQHAAWAYIDALLHFEVPEGEQNPTTTKLVLSMNKDNKPSVKIARRLGFEQGTDEDKEYSYSDGDDKRITNQNMDIYTMTPKAWNRKYSSSWF